MPQGFVHDRRRIHRHDVVLWTASERPHPGSGCNSGGRRFGERKSTGTARSGGRDLPAAAHSRVAPVGAGLPYQGGLGSHPGKCSQQPRHRQPGPARRRLITASLLRASFLSGCVVFDRALTYIAFAGARSGYGDKRACNKRTGPGCDSRRLHQPLTVFSTAGSKVGNGGPTSIDGRVKKTAFARPGPPYRAIL